MPNGKPPHAGKESKKDDKRDNRAEKDHRELRELRLEAAHIASRIPGIDPDAVTRVAADIVAFVTAPPPVEEPTPPEEQPPA